ncbi:MAG: hypothetical protein AAF740_02585, partial [Bacteroidota bacterium]
MAEEKKASFNLFEEVESWFEQFSLTREQAQKRFDEQKTKFDEQVKKFSEEFDSSEKAQKIKQKWEELQVQMALGKAEGKDALEAQKKKAAEGFHKLKQDLEELENTLEERGGEKFKGFKSEMGKLQTKFEAFQAQTTLSKSELSEEAEKRKQEATEKLKEFRQKAAAEREKSG